MRSLQYRRPQFLYLLLVVASFTTCNCQARLLRGAEDAKDDIATTRTITEGTASLQQQELLQREDARMLAKHERKLFQQGRATTRGLELEEDDVRISIQIINSEIFQLLFGILLICIVVFRLVMFGLLIHYRKHGNLQLAQPAVLAVLVLAGSLSIASCYFLLHINTTRRRGLFCLLRDPMILTPLTLAGSILLGLVWRIILLLTPILQLGGLSARDDNDEDGIGLGTSLKYYLLQFLTTLADSYYWGIPSWLATNSSW
jgi:hypothetical protein